MKRLVTIVAVIATLAVSLLASPPHASGVERSSEATAYQLSSRLVGSDVRISEPQLTGHASATARFESVGPLLEGVMLTTAGSESARPAPGDRSLTQLLRVSGLGGPTRDAVVLEFDLVPTATMIGFRYVFATDEDPRAGSPDVLGLWVDGRNLAVTDSGRPLTAYTMADAGPGLGYARTSEVMSAHADVSPGEAVHVTVAIADAANHKNNSAVFLEAFNRSPMPGELLMSENFENGTAAWEFPRLPLQVSTVDGEAAMVTDPETPAMQRGVTGSATWTDYRVHARVQVTEFTKDGAWFSLLGRYLDDDNYYQVQMMGHPANGTVALRKQFPEGSAYLAQRSWTAPVGEWLDMELILSGARIEFYVNGDLVITAVDHTHSHGRPGVATDRGAAVAVQSMTAESIPNPSVAGPPAAVTPGTYYVAPTGDDDNPGTESNPWRSLSHAAQVAQAGTTVIFEDGVYDESEVTTFTNSGTESARIVLRARNPHGAKIVYHGLPNSKLTIFGSSYVTLDGFEITQDAPGTTTADILVDVRHDANHVAVINNWIHGAFEEGVKGYLVDHLEVRGNLIEDMGHEGVDFVNVSSSLISSNTLRGIGRAGLLTKGGSTDIVIRNNTITALDNPMSLGAIYIGGVTGAEFTKDPSTNGFEAWNVVAYNNVIQADGPGGESTMPNAIAFQGAKDSAAYHNVITNLRYAFYLRPGGHLPSGWEWNPNNVNITIANNITTTVSAGHVNTGGATPVNLVHDHNLWHNTTATPPSEPHGIYADPQFLVPGSDWHLAPSSPARAAAPCIPTFTQFAGTTIDIRDDFDGELRTGTVCSLGVFR